MLNEDRPLHESHLPDEVRGYLLGVLDASRLQGSARLDVMLELIAHFEDGLAAGRSAEELQEEFGDGKLVGALISESRPESRRTTRRLRRIWNRTTDVVLGISQDLLLAMRGLRRHPGYAVVALLTLALGIGANTAVFSVVNAVLLRPLPYQNDQELVVPVLSNPSEGVLESPVGYADYLRWREQKDVFQKVGLYVDWNLNVTGGGNPERVKGALVSHRYFEVFRTPPVLGRMFAPEEHERGGGRVAVLSEQFWKRRFGSDSGVIGTSVTLDEEHYEVVGIVAPEAQWPREADIWMPLTFGAVTPDWVLEMDALGYSTVARLQQGVTIERAAAVADQIARRAAVERPDTRSGYGARIIPLRTAIVGNNTPRAMWLLMGCVGFVLLIACANVANLTLERSLGRQKEISIRAAIGAGRGRSVRPLVMECLLVAVFGGALGMIVAVWGTEALAALAPATLIGIRDVTVDSRLLVFGVAVSLTTGLAFALAPTYLAVRLDLRSALSEGSVRTGRGAAGKRARATMSVIQLALSVVLVLGASLIAKSTMRLVQTDPGFRGEGVLAMKVFLPHYPMNSPENDRIAQTYEAFTGQLASLPGAVSASAASALPLSADGLFDNLPFQSEGGAESSSQLAHFANWNVVGVDFFHTLGITISRGRVFTRDDISDGPRVAIISESFARELFPNEDPVGQRIRSTSSVVTDDRLEVVGVVEDVRYMDLTDAGRNVVYVPQSQSAWRAMAMVVRFEGDASGRADEVREAIWAVNASAPVIEVQTMAHVTKTSVAAPRFAATLVAVFATLALVLAVIGVYGVINVSMRQRYHELGVRKALGADGGNIGRLLVKQGARLAFVGIIIGLPCGFAMTRLLSGLLFEVRATDPMIFVGVPLLLAACAVLAAAVPARRAARVDPLEALRG